MAKRRSAAPRKEAKLHYRARAGAWLLSLALLCSGCTLMLDWSRGNKQQCGDAKECVDGYSCLGSLCIPDGSVPEDSTDPKVRSTCQLDRQCQDGLICASFRCRRPCSTPYEYTPECAAGEYCQAYKGDGSEAVGACARSQCTNDSDCGNPDALVCVRIEQAGVCLVPCAVTCAGAICGDNCDRSENNPPKYCQPLGTGTQKLICLDTSTTAQDAGYTCQPVLQPCLTGRVCSGGTCRNLCDPGSPACTLASCVEKSAAPSPYAVCE